VVNGLGRMRAYAAYTSLRYLLIGVGLVIARVRDVPADQLPAIWSLTEGVLLLALTVELVRTVALRRAAGWSAWVREHLVYGTRGAGATLLFEINSRLDVWLLGAAMSDAAVGIYSMAASMAEGASQLAVAVQVNLNPRIAAALAAGRRDEVEALVRSTRRWFVPAMAGVCALAAAGFPLIIPWITQQPDFMDGALPFAILVGGLALVAAWQPFNQILLMGSRPGWHTIYVALVVSANIAGCFLLIPRFGLVGTAIATAASLVFSAVLLMRMSRGLLGVRV
jgi:O-antigen/teichoic acid export membrane protein